MGLLNKSHNTLTKENNTTAVKGVVNSCHF